MTRLGSVRISCFCCHPPNLTPIPESASSAASPLHLLFPSAFPRRLSQCLWLLYLLCLLDPCPLAPGAYFTVPGRISSSLWPATPMWASLYQRQLPTPFPQRLFQSASSAAFSSPPQLVKCHPELPAFLIATKTTQVHQDAPLAQLGPYHVEKGCLFSVIWDSSLSPLEDAPHCNSCLSPQHLTLLCSLCPQLLPGVSLPPHSVGIDRQLLRALLGL